MPPERPAPDTPVAWIERARSDLTLAQATIPEVLNEDLSYHAQQCAEKALKAVLLYKVGRFPYVHDLADLLSRILDSGIELPDEIRDCAILTPYAVEARYPGFDEALSDEELAEAVDIAANALHWAEEIIRN